MKSLYIFAGSVRPDVYLNVISYCVEHYNVDSVFFIYISQDANDESNKTLSAIQSRVLDLSLSLAGRGDYLSWSADNTCVRTVLREVVSCEKEKSAKIYYSKINNCIKSFHREVWLYNEIPEHIDELKASESDFILDISSIKKQYVSDLVAICLVKQVPELFTLNLNLEPDFSEPWSALLGVQGEKDVSYTNLLNTEIYRKCRRYILRPSKRAFMVPLMFSILTFASAFIGFNYIEDSSILFRKINVAVVFSSLVMTLSSLFFYFRDAKQKSI